MKMTNLKKILSLLLCIVLIAATALFTIGCNDNSNRSENPLSSGNVSVTELGSGQNAFDFTVIDKEGRATAFKIKTNKTTVGDALLENSLIEGEESKYGLYVKTVNGLTLDYNLDGYYWSFYVDGKYASSGVDSTDISATSKYAFKAEKS